MKFLEDQGAFEGNGIRLFGRCLIGILILQNVRSVWIVCVTRR